MTSGGPELAEPGEAAEPGEEVVAELEHAPTSSAAVKHAAAVLPDRPVVLIICIPSRPLAALPERGHVSWLSPRSRCCRSGNTVTVTVLDRKSTRLNSSHMSIS